MANINLIYWEIYPGQRVKKPFALLYNQDKSKNKKISSDIMWGLDLYCSMKKSNPLHNMSKEERQAELLETFLTSEQLDKVIELEDAWVEQNLSYLQRRFRFYQRLIEQREEYMGTLTYPKDTDVIEKMLSSTKKIWDDVLSIKTKLDEEDLDVQVKGGREESASEKGLL